MQKKFLLADDDSDDSELFCEAVNEIDESIVCYLAADGGEVLEKLEDKTFDVPDVIFLDINMPEVNGWECLKALKSQPAYRRVPVIIYSTSSAERDIQKAYDLGAAYFLTKPDNYNVLKRFIGQVVQNIHGNLSEILKGDRANG